MRYLVASLLVVLALGCRPPAHEPALESAAPGAANGGHDRRRALKQVPPDDPCSGPGANSDSLLCIAFEGLVSFAQRTGTGGQQVLWALMPDASDPVNHPPACSNLAGPYPKHEAVVFVQDGTLYENKIPQGSFVSIVGYDFTISTGVTGMGPIHLDALISQEEIDATSLRLQPNGPTPLGMVDSRYVTPGSQAFDGYLGARIRLEAADAVEARANICFEQNPVELPRFFAFNAPDLGCDSHPVAGGVPIAEQVRATQAGVTGEVTLHLVKHDLQAGTSTTRELKVKRKDAATPLKIAFRNVINDGPHMDARGLLWEDCGVMDDHFAAYRWHYLLASDRGSTKSRCSWVPCKSFGPNGGKRCPQPTFEP